MNSAFTVLFIAYGVTVAGMLAGTLLMRADARAYWRLPVYAAMVMVLGIVSWNLLRKHLIPPEWELLHPGVLYYGVLGLYATLGILMGVLLGRLTRRKTSTADNIKEVDMDIPGPRPPPND
jgi:preprotein translocase subunit SecY